MSKEIRILLVEDNLINQKVMTHMVHATESAEIEAVESGEEAIERLEHTPFDLVIMDMQLEGMNGTETISRIRSFADRATSAQVPIVVLSGYADPQKESEARAAGANRYLLKPLGVEQLREVVEAARSATV